jgi:hypothetical protein
VLIGALVTLGFVLLFAGGLVIMGRASTGQWFWQIRDFEKNGLRARAKVLQRVVGDYSHSSGRVPFHKVELVLEVTIEGRPAYRIPHTEILDRFDSVVDVGNVVPIRVDPKDDKRVMLDVREIASAKKEARKQETARADAERAALLGNRPDR